MFADTFLDSYFAVLDQELHASFRKDLLFDQNANTAAMLILSANAETYLYLYPADRNELIVEHVEHPIQLELLLSEHNMTTIGSHKPSTDDLRMYPYHNAMFTLKNGGGGTIGYASIRSMYVPKMFRFCGTDNIAMIQKSNLMFGATEESSRVIAVDHIGLLAGDSYYVWPREKAHFLGQCAAEEEIRNLIKTSESFKQAMMHPQFEEGVRRINDKVSRRDKVPDFKYPLWQYKKDMKDLSEKAAQLDLTSYLNELFLDVSLKPKDGSLLCYYNTRMKFMAQWIIVGFIILVLCFVGRTLEASLQKHLPKIFIVRALLFAVVLGVNGWVFCSKPPSLTWTYWVLPGILYLTSVLVAVVNCPKTTSASSACCNLLKNHESEENAEQDKCSVRGIPRR